MATDSHHRFAALQLAISSLVRIFPGNSVSEKDYNFLRNQTTTTLDKTLETDPPVFQYRRLNSTLQNLYKLFPSPPPYNVVLAMMLAHTNPVVFKTILKEGRGEDRCLGSSVRGLVKNNRKIRVCFQFVSSRFVRGCNNWLAEITEGCFRNEMKRQATRLQLNAGLLSRNQTTGNWLAKITQARLCHFSQTRHAANTATGKRPGIFTAKVRTT